MANQFNKFIEVLAAFEKYDVEYVLIGGVALILHGSERLTRDIDILIDSDPANVEKLKKALYSVFDDSSVAEISPEELKKYSVIRYGTPDGFYIDIIDHIGELASFQVIESEILLYEGIKIRIAKPDALFELKKNSLRQKDQMDALFLKGLLKKHNE